MSTPSSDEPPTPRQPGRIATFYSYKGGTGRSMAVANVAWILASQGRKVLVIDWDLEAPGLHRYFHPFLEDPEMTSSPGLIDYFFDVAEAGRKACAPDTEHTASTEAWWESWTSLLRYTYPLTVKLETPSSKPFGTMGGIDFVPAGRQCPEYADKVGSFDWPGFYDRMGGGVFLEAVKKRLRERYDYVLIDSRTGISDTSGICTVQMPDDLVVCFTLNQQSMKGAAAVAASAEDQRRTKSGKPGLRIWPVPTRIEMAEKDRLEVARTEARKLFLRHFDMTRLKRDEYWGRAEVLYQPYYAYEEVLAVFAERLGHAASILASFEFLTSVISGGDVSALSGMSEPDRVAGLARFSRPDVTKGRPESKLRSQGFAFLSCGMGLAQYRDALKEELASAGISTWSETELLPGDEWQSVLREKLESSSVLLVIIGASGLRDEPFQLQELRRALELRKPVIPVLVEGAAPPRELEHLMSSQLALPLDRREIQRLVSGLRRLLPSELLSSTVFNPDDPQKGCWGGQTGRNGRVLSADVFPIDANWFRIAISVRSTDGKPLKGEVIFHIHPTLRDPLRRVKVVDGAARLELQAYGAFTVGAEADDGSTTLELDLSEDSRFPAEFRAR